MAGMPLSVHEREEIRVGIEAGESFAGIGRRLGRSTSTVSREVARNGGRRYYKATRAQGACEASRRRARDSKDEAMADPHLVAYRGGTTERERARMRRERTVAQQAPFPAYDPDPCPRTAPGTPGPIWRKSAGRPRRLVGA